MTCNCVLGTYFILDSKTRDQRCVFLYLLLSFLIGIEASFLRSFLLKIFRIFPNNNKKKKFKKKREILY